MQYKNLKQDPRKYLKDILKRIEYFNIMLVIKAYTYKFNSRKSKTRNISKTRTKVLLIGRKNILFGWKEKIIAFKRLYLR